jgi:hypothetical protein
MTTKSSTTSDLRVVSINFNSTTTTVEAVTEAGRNLLASLFGAGALSVTLPASRAGDFLVFAQRKGLRA